MATKKSARLKKSKASTKSTKKATSGTANVKKAKSVTALSIIQKQAMQDPRVWGGHSSDVDFTHFLPKKRASQWVRRFNRNPTPIPKSAFMQPENFDKKIFQDLLSRPEVVGLRTYFGLNDKNRVRLLFVGADINDNDVYVKKPVDTTGKANRGQKAPDTTASEEEEGVIDFGQSCPSYTSGNIVLLP